MSIKKTEAFVLKSFNWSESSRTISFFSRDQGKLPLSDRGGRSIKSKRGRALPFARLGITFYSSDRPSNGHLSEVSVQEAWSFEREGSLGRLAFGSAACELLWLTLPDEEPHPEIFDYTLKFFAAIDSVAREALPAVFLAYFFRLLSFLGYQPVLSGCLACGKSPTQMQSPKLVFSPDRGGLLCPACQVAGETYIGLSLEDLTESLKLQTSSLEEAAGFKIDFTRASRIMELMLKFLQTQTGIKKLNSLEFLERLKNFTN